MAEMRRAKLFRNGGSQAVRLPKEFRFQGSEVHIRRDGQAVVLEPVGPQIVVGDLDRARKVIESFGPLEPELSAILDEAMQNLQRS